MNKNNKNLFCAVAVVGLSVAAVARAEEHRQQVLEHTQEAVDSAGDSKAIGEHAQEALKHMDAAKAAQPGDKHLKQSEAELQNAVKNATRFNSGAAEQDAKDAKGHLEQAKPR